MSKLNIKTKEVEQNKTIYKWTTSSNNSSKNDNHYESLSEQLEKIVKREFDKIDPAN